MANLPDCRPATRGTPPGVRMRPIALGVGTMLAVVAVLTPGTASTRQTTTCGRTLVRPVEMYHHATGPQKDGICVVALGAGSTTATLEVTDLGGGTGFLTARTQDGSVLVSVACTGFRCAIHNEIPVDVETWQHDQTNQLILTYVRQVQTSLTFEVSGAGGSYDCSQGECIGYGSAVKVDLSVVGERPPPGPPVPRTERAPYLNGVAGVPLPIGVICNTLPTGDQLNVGGACFGVRPDDAWVRLSIDDGGPGSIGARYTFFDAQSVALSDGDFCSPSEPITAPPGAASLQVDVGAGPAVCRSSDSGTVAAAFNA